jgi:hypothetical protein
VATVFIKSTSSREADAESLTKANIPNKWPVGGSHDDDQVFFFHCQMSKLILFHDRLLQRVVMLP